MNSIVSLVTLPKPIATSEVGLFEDELSPSALTRDAGTVIIIRQINSTLNRDICYLIYLPHINDRFHSYTVVTNQVTQV